MANDPTARSKPSPRGAVRGLPKRAVLVSIAIAALCAIAAGAIVFNVLDKPANDGDGQLTAVKKVPDVSFTRFDGTTGKLSEYRGQKLVVNFFASSCVPCRKEMPELDKIQEKAGDEITVIGFAVQDEKSAAAAFVKKVGARYQTALDPTGQLLYQSGGGTNIPYTIFVAADGTIMDSHFGAMTQNQLQKAISVNLLAGG